MKKMHIAIIAAAIMIGYGQYCEAKYEQGYEVIHVEGKVITIQKKGGETVKVDEGKKEFRIGDRVEYDAEKARIRRPSGGC